MYQIFHAALCTATTTTKTTTTTTTTTTSTTTTTTTTTTKTTTTITTSKSTSTAPKPGTILYQVLWSHHLLTWGMFSNAYFLFSSMHNTGLPQSKSQLCLCICLVNPVQLEGCLWSLQSTWCKTSRSNDSFRKFGHLKSKGVFIVYVFLCWCCGQLSQCQLTYSYSTHRCQLLAN